MSNDANKLKKSKVKKDITIFRFSNQEKYELHFFVKFSITYFQEFNSTKVSYANYERLAAVAALLQANLNYKLKVIGYADSVGNNSNNMKVAMNRANAVIEILNTVFNIDKSRLTPESKGEESPLANESVKMTQKSSDGQVITNSLNRMNRRVEFVIQ